MYFTIKKYVIRDNCDTQIVNKIIIMFFFYTFYIHTRKSSLIAFQKINRSIVSLFSAGGVLKFISAICFFVGLFFTFMGHHVSRVEKMFPIFFIGSVIGYAIEGMYIRQYFYYFSHTLLVIKLYIYIYIKNNKIFSLIKKFNKIIKK